MEVSEIELKQRAGRNTGFFVYGEIMKLKSLITRLKTIEKKYGDIPVILSSDEEGNSYSNIDEKWSFGEVRDEKWDEKRHTLEDPVIGICIYPFKSFWDDYIKAVKES